MCPMKNQPRGYYGAAGSEVQYPEIQRAKRIPENSDIHKGRVGEGDDGSAVPPSLLHLRVPVRVFKPPYCGYNNFQPLCIH